MLVAAFAPVAVPAAQQGRSMSKAATAAFIPVARPSIATFTRKGAVAMRARSRCSSVATTANAAPAKPTGPYAVVNRFRAIDATSGPEFEALIKAREAEMAKLPGFVSASHTKDGNNEYTVSQTWDSKEAYEKWMNSLFRRTSQPPAGIWQFRPSNKFSVPEDFCPFVRGGDEE